MERSRDPAVLGARRCDLVLLCDVLEHVEDDGGLLRRRCTDHLAPARLAMVTTARRLAIPLPRLGILAPCRTS